MQIAICDDEKSIGLILEEKIKKLLPDAVTAPITMLAAI